MPDPQCIFLYAAIVTASVALLMMNFSRSGRTADESHAWLKHTGMNNNVTVEIKCSQLEKELITTDRRELQALLSRES